MTDPTRQPARPDEATAPAQPEQSYEDIPVVTETTPAAAEPERLTREDVDRLAADTTAEPTTPNQGEAPTADPNDGLRLNKQRRWYNKDTGEWTEGEPPEGYEGPFE